MVQANLYKNESGEDFLSIVRIKGQHRSKTHLDDDGSSLLWCLLSHVSLVWMGYSFLACIYIAVPGVSYHHHSRDLLCPFPVMFLLVPLS